MRYQDSIQRFSQRAGNYDRFRPDYPQALLSFLHETVPITPGLVIADIAAGTGIFTEQIASWGSRVYVIEPNPYMRSMARRRLSACGRCVFLDGTAEATGLPDRSVDLFVSAQAFHWFDLAKTKAEFERTSRSSAHVAVVWNLRNTRSAFESGYELFIRSYATDYLQVSQRKMDTADVRSFFAPSVPKYRVFGHVDSLTYEQLLGRTLSYSFLPDELSPVLPEMTAALEALFKAHQREGRVRLSYKARLFVGQI
ncbi:class I SAM-dependent methyltransferase [Parapedobacter soli]|uniref:class I SAM-dependent methyltransferase n=1 Tax=Parapedobacter soli TaxID=416955 RepID=UPI0021CABEAC|nr:class I SAM-dependent methyltransferase [Parapedobacter soli]